MNLFNHEREDYILEHTGICSVFEQCAEECCELGQVCLKMARKIRNQNPTPKRMNEIEKDFKEEVSKEFRLYRDKTDRNWNISYEMNTFCDINSLRNLSQFDIFLMTLKRGFVEIEIDTESEYEDDIEPEETPEWSLD